MFTHPEYWVFALFGCGIMVYMRNYSYYNISFHRKRGIVPVEVSTDE